MTFPAQTCTALLRSFVTVPRTLERDLSSRFLTCWWGGLPSRMTRRRMVRSRSLVTTWYLPSCLPRLIDRRASSFAPVGPGVLTGIFAWLLLFMKLVSLSLLPLPLSVSGFDLRRTRKEKKEIVGERAVSNQGSNVRIDDDGSWTVFFCFFLRS